MSTVQVAVVGYGVIGRRVADAVQAQSDMDVVGVAAPLAGHTLPAAREQGFAVFTSDIAGQSMPGIAQRESQGDLAALVEISDVVLDCTPSGVPPTHADVTGRAVTIVQGGETAASAEVSFNAFANYAEAAGKRRVRVVSCSTTGTTRFLYALDRGFGVEQAFVGLVRRASDPGKRSRIPINAVVPGMGQSHHGPDARTVLPHLSVYTVALLTPTTLSHVLNFQVDLSTSPARDDVLAALDDLPRITVGTGLASTVELASDAARQGRRRRDRPEIYVWEESVRVVDGTVYASIAVHMESITVPETVDCVRAALEIESDPWASMRKTDRALGIEKRDACYRREPR